MKVAQKSAKDVRGEITVAAVDRLRRELRQFTFCYFLRTPPWSTLYSKSRISVESAQLTRLNSPPTLVASNSAFCARKQRVRSALEALIEGNVLLNPGRRILVSSSLSTTNFINHSYCCHPITIMQTGLCLCKTGTRMCLRGCKCISVLVLMLPYNLPMI